ncbi:VWA domain-containing protein [Streptomyces sp. NPDC096152]|uniref:vWA domain-containing protein n=1 Tax=Streptomyces sp. NPDC096152 TaxID=3366078 RepID=UPI003824C3FA
MTTVPDADRERAVPAGAPPGGQGSGSVRPDGGTAGPPGADAALLGFARALRAAGVAASAERAHAFLRAVDVLGPSARSDVYWAGRLTLCGDRDDLERYERVFAAYFGAGEATARAPRSAPPPRLRPVLRDAPAGARTGPPDGTRQGPPTATLAGSAEVLRHRDVAGLDDAERAQVRRLLAAFALRGRPRRTARRRPSRRGDVDPHRTVRELLRRGGEPARLRRQARAERPRRVVLLVDISGSMAPYADALLRFAHAAARGGRAEVFTIGTRLTRVTRELSHRDPDLAMAAVAEAVPDWRGGTRLGELLREFLDRWGQRGMARGAVVVLLSDGWERGDPELLAAQMRRLHRLAYRVIWANPRKARPGYAPLAAGMAAALPSVDAFVEGHSLAALEHLAAVVRGDDPAAGAGSWAGTTGAGSGTTAARAGSERGITVSEVPPGRGAGSQTGTAGTGSQAETGSEAPPGRGGGSQAGAAVGEAPPGGAAGARGPWERRGAERA